jgi:hypothetical protein
MQPLRPNVYSVIVTTVCLTLIGCNPENDVNSYFRDKGLNRLKVPSTLVKPGGVFLVEGKNTTYCDTMFAYDATASPKPAITTIDYDAKLSGRESTRKVNASLAVTVLSMFLPFKIAGDLTLASTVTIDPSQPKVSRIMVPDILAYLKSSNAAGFISFVRDQTSKDSHVFVAYEVYQTNEMKITAEKTYDFSASATQAQDLAPVKEGKLSIAVNGSDKSQLLIKGNDSYVVAVRAARIDPGAIAGAVMFNPRFAGPGALGSTKDQSERSVPLQNRFDPVEITTVRPAPSH